MINGQILLMRQGGHSAFFPPLCVLTSVGLGTSWQFRFLGKAEQLRAVGLINGELEPIHY